MPSTHPPFDSELLQRMPSIREFLPTSILPSHIRALRARNLGAHDVESMIQGRDIVHRTLVIAKARGKSSLELSIFSPSNGEPPRPAVYFVHGGGLIAGNRFSGATQYLRWVEELGVSVVSVEYRLAPENPYPAAHDDCFRGLEWTLENAGDLGVNPNRVAIVGISAGGGLAAGVVMRRRDLRLSLPSGQMLVYPMLDDRNETVSSRQIQGIGVWDRLSNETGWTAYLGENHRASEVETYAAPGRAASLFGLPPTYIDVGTAEVFRDEAVSYATRIWHCGGDAELHVWSGAFHGFDVYVPEAEVSRNAIVARLRWLRRTLRV